MAPPPPFGANSAAERDIVNVLNPCTDLQAHQQVGPMVVTRGKGVRVWGARNDGRAVVGEVLPVGQCSGGGVPEKLGGQRHGLLPPLLGYGGVAALGAAPANAGRINHNITSMCGNVMVSPIVSVIM